MTKILIILFAGIILIILDCAKKINLLGRVVNLICLLMASNIVAVFVLTRSFGIETEPGSEFRLLLTGLILPVVYFWFRAHLFPIRKVKKNKQNQEEIQSLRIRVLSGGKFLVRLSVVAIFIELIVLIWVLLKFEWNDPGMGGVWIAINFVFAFVSQFLLLWNGILRVFFTSKYLGISYRVLLILVSWIPIVNIIVLLKACKRVDWECDYEKYKQGLDLIKAENDSCKTKYPILLVHGIFFRDMKLFNYWGRIPRTLIKCGATIAYGNQEACATVENNAYDIKKAIEGLIESTGADKVNIIAHSKGGLDSRYAISKLEMYPKVASLTTINSPHRGCRFVDKACKLPDGFYRMIAKHFDRIFRAWGDKNPDFYTATRQFSTKSSEAFNAEITDAPQVYYQSVASYMKNCFSDSVLTIPYLFSRSFEKKTDGLVSLQSARWGENCRVLEPKGSHGISHADVIDLRRCAFPGLDPIVLYVDIVKELKDKGF
ncbi:MAG: triacylglycerol lipase [Lachnospiraceae bacterium]|jgi:triacylglycerol lipase|nr:triacylglycerol lipase [Lachnospiraceae bacterium]